MYSVGEQTGMNYAMHNIQCVITSDSLVPLTPSIPYFDPHKRPDKTYKDHFLTLLGKILGFRDAKAFWLQISLPTLCENTITIVHSIFQSPKCRLHFEGVDHVAVESVI